jgi:hypothetical protein
MRKFFSACILYLVCLNLSAQNIHLMAFGGLSNYQGDLQAKKFTFDQAQAAFGGGLLYEITDNLYARLAFTYGKVSAADKFGKNTDRNLSFSSPIYEVQIGAEYDLLNNYERSLVPYAFLSIAAFNFNPTAVDKRGKTVELQPLGTEGQGFSGKAKYNLTQLAIPFGGGLKLAINENVRLRGEIGLRYLLTDYLDDVSDSYPDKNLLLANNGQLAVDMSFRGGEVKPSAVFPGVNNKRGNPKVNDFYYFATVGISFRIQLKESTSYHGKAKYGCPTNIW